MRWSGEKQIKIFKNKDALILVILLILLGLSLLNLKGDRVYILTDGKTEEIPKLDLFCRSFITQIISKNLQKEMVEPDIFDVLIADNYKVLNLVGHENVLFSRADTSTCSVIVKDQLGLRRFEITVNVSENYPFFFRVQKIDEPTLEG